jgi:microsomal dipeptidase-like Zn-dependent dipeptidase
MSNLGFAGKLLYGGVDADPAGGALLPADPDCHAGVRATSPAQALGHDGSTHGGWGLDLDPLDLLSGKFGVTNPCGDVIRQQVIAAVQSVNEANNPGPDASGYPDFPSWPEWDDITHQAMWIDWIKRAHDAGLSVMVALAVNNETLADAVAGPGDGPDDDMTSADLQVAEMKKLVARHSDWMEIAYSSSDVRRIVYNKRLAVVLGLEVDNLGDFNRKTDLSHDDIVGEIARLKAEGVRYLFPIHLIDNSFGTTAAYDDIFNLSNLREAGHFWNLVCASPGDDVTYSYAMGNPLTQTVDLDAPSTLVAEMAGLMVAKLGMLSDTFDPPTVPSCPGGGMVNRGVEYPGLTPNGTFAIEEMMRQGMLIDVDHMSQASVDDALGVATREHYPVNSGHNAVRTAGGNERALTSAEYAVIGKLHGMAGLGVSRTNDVEWLGRYEAIAQAMGGPPGAIGFGTDASGLSTLMRPPDVHRVDYTSDFPRSALGTASWDYNDAGVAHYGMLADFMRAVPTLDGGVPVVPALMQGAQYFADTWQLAEAYAQAHGPDAGAGVAAQPTADASAPGPAAASVPTSPASCPSGTTYAAACGKCLAPGARCTLVRPTCHRSRTRDRWGLCVSAHARRAVVNPASGTKGGPGPSLTAGEYTLVLAETAISDPNANRGVKGFDVQVASNGRRVTLGSSNAKTGAKVPDGAGGFRGRRFTLRIDAGDQVLILTAKAPDDTKRADIRGAFVAHAPGQAARTGLFVLQKTSTLGKPPQGLASFDGIEAYLTELRK